MITTRQYLKFYSKDNDGRMPQIWSIEDAEKVLSNYFRDYDKEDFYKYDAYYG